jgi:hypothetical protein
VPGRRSDSVALAFAACITDARDAERLTLLATFLRACASRDERLATELLGDLDSAEMRHETFPDARIRCARLAARGRSRPELARHSLDALAADAHISAESRS